MRTQAFGIVVDALGILCRGKEEERTECEKLASLPSLAQQLENLQNSVFPLLGPWEMKQGPIT